MANTAKRLQKAQAVLNGGGEPTLEQLTFRSDLTRALSWYNNHEDDKTKRKWLATYLTTNGLKQFIPLFNDMPDWEIRQLATLARIKARDQYLDENTINWMKEKVVELIKKFQAKKKAADEKVVEDKPVTNVISIQDRMEEKARELAAEIDAAIDDFTINKKSDFSCKNYLLANQVAAPIAKRIGEFYLHTSAEIHEAIAGDDKQLVEGYSNFTKRELKKFAEFVDNIISDCQQMIVTAKANRAPRKRKEVSPTKLASKMKFMKEFAELNLKSVKPETIIGSTEVWFYNTKYRRVGVYKGENGGTLSIKGTTILGFDIKESKMFTLRKPEEFFKGLSMGKRALNSAIKTLKTKPAQPNGRINEEIILLGAF